ncbi:hypothetical protein DSO57_1036540 [Entomophthora muscae]|uniref:Uncharacterized protein n=1 Tax=Entomophthora muscae TaxID=34485 RepID=A0ACC2RQ91_9FUNG|nr:hypothetical protein DSO57_1036540 [Entomophthora muscae]
MFTFSSDIIRHDPDQLAAQRHPISEPNLTATNPPRLNLSTKANPVSTNFQNLPRCAAN